METKIFNSSSMEMELSQTWISSSTFQSPLYRVIFERFVCWSNWQYIITLLLGIIFYDQGKHGLMTVDLVSSAECKYPVMYIKHKGSIAGPTFKIPLMGPFVQALHPKFESYLAQWASGPLSCVSVFHKYVALSQLFHSVQC